MTLQGWTDQEGFDKMNGNRQPQQRSSLTLPQVKRDDDFYEDYMHEKENVRFAALPDKLPDISNNTPTKLIRELEEIERQNMERRKAIQAVSVSKGKGKRSPQINKLNRKLYNTEQPKLVYPDDLYEKQPKPEEYLKKSDKKPTPEENILRVTGGIELVPLLARRRRVGARTLPSSDVTRPPEQSCQ